MSEPSETVACELCGKQTMMTGTRRCNRCWELETRIERDPKLAMQILARIQAPDPAAEALAKEVVLTVWKCTRLENFEVWMDKPKAEAAVKQRITAALQAERERAARIAELWANSHSCDVHDDNPCCHVRTGAAIAEKIRSKEPTNET